MPNSASNSAEVSPSKFEAALQVAQAIASQRDLAPLLHVLADLLHTLVQFDFIEIILHDPATNRMRLQVMETAKRFEHVPADGLSIDEAPAGWVWVNQLPLLCDISELELRFPKIAPLMMEQRIQSYCILPLTSARGRLGGLAFGSIQPNAYSDSEIRFMQLVVSQVAVAVDNALNFERARAYQEKLTKERDHLRTLLEVTNAVVSKLDTQALLMEVSSSIRRILDNDYTSLVLHDPATNELRLHALDFPGGRGIVREGMVNQLDGSPAGRAMRTKEPVVLSRPQLEKDAGKFEILRQLLSEGVKAVCIVPLLARGRVLGTLNVGTVHKDAFTPDQVGLLVEIAGQVGIAVENAMVYQEISQLKDKLAREKRYLEEEIRTDYNFEEIVGESAALKQVLEQVETVAGSDSTVLILGETGTGKELIARAIHNRSGRRHRTFVKMNCAALPAGLIESELFGHEKGAFTGAISQKVGRFELAHQGTLLLDEIADIPLELQPKLLRAIQEREFERLGGTRTLRVDARLLVATNRDLSRMVADRQFRTDLYYRINVFPIVIPPLRERPEDIPLLVRHFTQKYARRMNRKIESIADEAMRLLTQMPWPGNARELENLIERAVILTRGSVLNVPITEFHTVAAAKPATPVLTTPSLQTVEREHIQRVLRETNGIVSGPRGAAARLGLKRTTLLSRMQHLGISAKEINS